MTGKYMIDFRRKLSEKNNEKPIDPSAIYETLDRQSVTGPMRPVQEEILKEWYERHLDDRDVVVKLHTGEGKTLIGLLMLQSKINAGKGSCLYICPNKYLVHQVCKEARKFGIPYCVIDDNNKLPTEFENGEKILIVHAQKVFNGRSIFGIYSESIKAGCVVLDDSHACIDVIRDSQTIRISREKSRVLFDGILQLFNDDLVSQGEGSLFDIKNEDTESFLMVPYWSLLNKRTELLHLLSEQSANSDSEVFFSWPIVKDKLQEYACFISGKQIEISPYCATVEMYGTFKAAGQRILMSATTQDDSFLVKGLNFETNSIENPLISRVNTWSGEKMIIIPSIIDENCDRNAVVTYFSETEWSNFGVVSLVPNSFKTSQYQDLGAVVANRENVIDVIEKLKKGEINRMVVMNNRYDGIDLPDESCRVLILDSVPAFKRMSDKYEKKCRPESEEINKKIAQKIEQGLGRSVRGEKDYCAIIIIGSDLVKFVMSKNSRKYFSAQTQKQFDIGLDISNWAKDEVDNTKTSIYPTVMMIKQILNRDEGWKDYYNQTMNAIQVAAQDYSMYERLVEENKIEQLYKLGDYTSAAEKMQHYIDKFISDESEKGWYLQQKARYIYSSSKEESIKLQIAAFKLNSQLLHPQCEIEYKKLSYIQCMRMQMIRSYISKYNDYNDFIIDLSAVLEDLSFGVEADKFEAALDTIGKLLGFACDRPDHMIKKGPDNLWCGVNNEYCFFECKSEVSDIRNVIHKKESGQMNNHCGWFEKQYGSSVSVARYMIIPTKDLAKDANFTHEVRIIRRSKLKKFKSSVMEFAHEMSKYDIHDLVDEQIQKWINLHRLNMSDIYDAYSEPPFLQ